MQNKPPHNPVAYNVATRASSLFCGLAGQSLAGLAQLTPLAVFSWLTLLDWKVPDAVPQLLLAVREATSFSPGFSSSRLNQCP